MYAIVINLFIMIITKEKKTKIRRKKQKQSSLPTSNFENRDQIYVSTFLLTVLPFIFVIVDG